MTTHSPKSSSTELTAIDRDINFVIMDYLINEGYPSAAQKFAKEANIIPSSDIEAIQERVDIRNAILAGNIQLAIEKINELNPQVNPRPLFFLPPSPPCRDDTVSCTTQRPPGIAEKTTTYFSPQSELSQSTTLHVFDESCVPLADKQFRS